MENTAVDFSVVNLFPGEIQVFYKLGILDWSTVCHRFIDLAYVSIVHYIREWFQEWQTCGNIPCCIPKNRRVLQWMGWELYVCGSSRDIFYTCLKLNLWDLFYWCWTVQPQRFQWNWDLMISRFVKHGNLKALQWCHKLGVLKGSDQTSNYKKWFLKSYKYRHLELLQWFYPFCPDNLKLAQWLYESRLIPGLSFHNDIDMWLRQMHLDSSMVSTRDVSTQSILKPAAKEMKANQSRIVLSE